MDIIKEGDVNIPENAEEKLETVQEQAPEVKKFRIIGAGKDPNFEGLTIIKTEDAEGKITGYAIRQTKDGSFEGNEIKYQPDGSIGSVYELHESDFNDLRQLGILESYEGALANEKSNNINAAKLAILRMYMQGDKFDPAWNRYPEKDLMNSVEEALKGLDPDDQEKLAIDFFGETIGKDISNNRNAYKVYSMFKNTPFGQRFRQLEDQRLKEAGYAGFNL